MFMTYLMFFEAKRYDPSFIKMLFIKLKNPSQLLCLGNQRAELQMHLMFFFYISLISSF